MYEIIRALNILKLLSSVLLRGILVKVQDERALFLIAASAATGMAFNRGMVCGTAAGRCMGKGASWGSPRLNRYESSYARAWTNPRSGAVPVRLLGPYF
jgi:hypothetical protein